MNARHSALFSCLLAATLSAPASATVIDSVIYGGHAYYLLELFPLRSPCKSRLLTVRSCLKAPKQFCFQRLITLKFLIYMEYYREQL